MSKVRLRIIGLIAVLLVVLSGCSCSGSRDIAKPALAEGAQAVNVKGACTAALLNGGKTLSVTGTCNLMDGTNGIISVLSAEGRQLESHKFTKEGEDLGWDFEVGKDWPGVVYGFISFDTQNCDAQPKEVTEAYGKRFQNLEGPDVIWDMKGVIAVFQSEAVDVTGEGQNAQ